MLYRLPEQRAGSGGVGLAAVLALTVLVFAGGLVLGRLTAPSSGTAGRSAAQSGLASRPATAPTGTGAAAQAAAPQAAATQAGASVGGVGPARVRDGVATGWAHSRDGAVAAATSYATLLSGPLILDARRRHAAIAAVAAPAAEADLQRTFDQLAPLLAKGLRAGQPGSAGGAAQLVLRAIPVGWRLDSYDGARAQVAIWSTGIGGSTAGIPVQEAWGITTIGLAWVVGDWRVTSAKTEDGPVPVADDATPADAPALGRQAQDFKEYRYAPGSP